ncbi:cupin domain-containing protein [Actinosynnema sp. NPDC020468]|uniref:cupin domain-containing protein n=1 Tax=Actinosynnema sp. NPDC020468 TaxID=3154488 RepID=UPI0033FC710C
MTDEIVVVPSGQTYEGKQGHAFFAGISTETAGSRGLCMHLVRIPPGARDNPHRHDGHESAIYVISGVAEGRYGADLAKRVTANPGDFVYIPAGVPHQAINPSTTEHLVAIIARTDPHEQESVVLLPDPDEA